MQKSKYHILFYLITPMFSSIYYEIANIIINKGQIPTREGVRNIWRKGPSFLGGIEPGWDEIFYFVGANTFSQKFCPKQRESDTTEGVKD